MEHKKAKKDNAQKIQDEIFRKMPVEKKLEMLNGFFRFAKTLNTLGKNNGRNRASKKSCGSFEAA